MRNYICIREFDKIHVERISQWLTLRALKTNELYKVK